MSAQLPRRRRKPGPKALIRNPRPALIAEPEPGHPLYSHSVSAMELDYSERVLIAYLSDRRKQLVARPGESPKEAERRITRLASNALSETNAVWWSGYARDRVVDNPYAFDPPRPAKRGRARQVQTTPDPLRPWNPPSLRRASRPWGRGGARRHVGSKPPPKPENKCLWLDTSATPAVLRRHDRNSGSWRPLFEVDDSIAADELKAGKFVVDMTRRTPWLLQTSWPVVAGVLGEPISRMLDGEMGRAGKSGRPAFLACATLGVLLDTTPEKIADLLDNCRHPRRRKI